MSIMGRHKPTCAARIQALHACASFDCIPRVGLLGSCTVHLWGVNASRGLSGMLWVMQHRLVAGLLVQLVSRTPGVLQAQLGVQVVQLPVAAQQKAPHLCPSLLPLLHSADTKMQ